MRGTKLERQGGTRAKRGRKKKFPIIFSIDGSFNFVFGQTEWWLQDK
jgi:hypothetical protein